MFDDGGTDLAAYKGHIFADERFSLIEEQRGDEHTALEGSEHIHLNT
jgi:hypothetical protein